jgi:hypothetical protein
VGAREPSIMLGSRRTAKGDLVKEGRA